MLEFIILAQLVCKCCDWRTDVILRLAESRIRTRFGGEICSESGRVAAPLAHLLLHQTVMCSRLSDFVVREFFTSFP